MRPALHLLAAAGLLLGLVGCADGEPVRAEPPATPVAGGEVEPQPSPAPGTVPDTAREPAAAEPQAPTRPDWLGTRVLPARPGGYGEVQPTPPELVDRRLPPPVVGESPGDEFAATVSEVPPDVTLRSTWEPGCPVVLGDLRYVTVSFWGFDGRPHTGELLVHASAAEDLVTVFGLLFEARFPIEEMRVVEAAELDAPPTGDGNNTTAFVCRPSRGSTSWSEHAHGLAVDINPFHNPYLKGDLVLPELAAAYTDRGHHRPGMIQPGDAATGAFAGIGWSWGGHWSSAKDWMHFSASGR